MYKINNRPEVYTYGTWLICGFCQCYKDKFCIEWHCCNINTAVKSELFSI